MGASEGVNIKGFSSNYYYLNFWVLFTNICLSHFVCRLVNCLAQRDSCGGGLHQKKAEEEKAITGLLDGSGEYTLVYEDNEGDRMLVGDVPWQ